ncbi:SDR family NAD(P)-dependent oxidoreductase [Liberiplasma polymorphum]|uniref:SDR family NAD(P)-dependent oxidoreductase n=1 Tax=Liberiplasma polymorphum TaxID=3374570 RepID=UPI0037753237
MKQEKVIIITGAASGIGEETAYKLAETKAKLVISDLNEEDGNKVVKKVKSMGTDAIFIKADVSKANEVKLLIDKTVEHFGNLTGIFNNAGIGEMKPFLELEQDDYDKMININQNGVFYGMQFAGRKMKELGVKNGVIVNTASIYGFIGAEASAHYNATKAAVVSLTKSGAQALTKDGIRVVGVAPGFTKTAILEAVDDEMLEALKDFHMREKLIEPGEIANVVKFLFSDESSAINGSTVLADDGYLAFK